MRDRHGPWGVGSVGRAGFFMTTHKYSGQILKFPINTPYSNNRKGFKMNPDVIAVLVLAAVALVAVAILLLEKSGKGPLRQKSQLEIVSDHVVSLKRKGADPLVVAHVAQAVTAVANDDLSKHRPDLVAQDKEHSVKVVDKPNPTVAHIEKASSTDIVKPATHYGQAGLVHDPKEDHSLEGHPIHDRIVKEEGHKKG